MKLERIISIIMLLLQKDKVTAKELSEMFEVSSRTIYRDIDSINLAGIPIVAVSGVHGGISIMEGYKVEKGIFTKEDLVQLLMGTNALSGTLENPQTAIILSKIKSFIPENSRQEIESKSENITFNFSVLEDHDLKQKLQSLQDAINSRTIVHFYYWNTGYNEKRSVEPYKLIFQQGYWYLQGYCQKRNNFRIFKISRLWDIGITDTVFTPRTIPPAFAEYHRQMKQRQIPAELIVDSSILNAVLDHCGKECCTQISDTQYRVLYPFIPSDYDYGVLLSFGDKCECIAPHSVRKELQSRIERLQKRYQDI